MAPCADVSYGCFDGRPDRSWKINEPTENQQKSPTLQDAARLVGVMSSFSSSVTSRLLCRMGSPAVSATQFPLKC